MISDPSLLIVEDKKRTREDLEYEFSQPPGEFQRRYGISGFRVETADSAKAALEKLKRARKAIPFDVMLLDLGLPRRSGARSIDEWQVGVRLLRSVSDRSCTAIVVISVHGYRPEVLIDLIRTRAIYDFVQKPWDPENKQVLESVAQAYFRGQHRIWEEIRRGRAEHWLLVQACAQVADRMARVVSAGIGDLVAEAERLKSQLEGQLHAPLAFDNPVSKSLADLRVGALSIVERCTGARKNVSPEFGELQRVALESIVDRVVQKLGAGFTCKKLTLEGPRAGEHTVHTFPDAVRNILEEMVFSAVEASPEQGNVRLQVAPVEETRTVEVSVADEGEPLDSELCQRIAGAEPIARKNGRGWGLSLAQRVANDIGASIVPKSTESGNTVTLRIPLTFHDQPVGGR